MAAKKKKVLIIAGHGEGDPGACSKWGREADYARELATLVKKSIGTKMSVTMYDQSKNCYYQSKNGKVPDYAAYDYTLEIHFNAKTTKDPDGNGVFTGAGGYYHPNNKGRDIADAMVKAIAAMGFKVWQNCTSTGLLNLNKAQAAGARYFLLETAFIDDGDDMNFYTKNRERVAQAVAQTLISGLGVSGEATLSDVAKTECYRVRTTWEDAASQKFAGTLEGAKKACPAGYSVFDPDGKCVYTKESNGTQAGIFANMSEAEYVAYIGEFYRSDEEKNGILACVSMAQGILESGYGKTDLAQNGNNLHGMKCILSSNTWKGTTWNGTSSYTKMSPEQDKNGNEALYQSAFRKYDCIEDSIEDHAMYLLGAANGSEQRYKGLQGEKDYKKAVTIIKNGGYATDKDYIDKICNIIQKWNLVRFNVGNEEIAGEIQAQETREAYEVKVTADILNIRSGPGSGYPVTGKIKDKGAYTIVEEKDGWGKLKSGTGWISLSYTQNAEGGGTSAGSSSSGVPYLVTTTCEVLNIRSGAGTRYRVTGTISESEGKKKEYTIVEEKSGWGRLKSGAGWINLSYTRRAS